MSEDPVDPEVRLRELQQARVAERVSAPNWTLRIAIVTFVVFPLLVWGLPRLIVGDHRDERWLERALRYCDDATLDRCRERVSERHRFCFDYADDTRGERAMVSVYGECMHTMYPDFYLKVGDNILEK